MMPAGDRPTTTVERPYWRLEQQLEARRRATPGIPGQTEARATDERTTLAPTDEPATMAARRWLKTASIAASLVAAAVGWWLYLSEVANFIEMPTLPAKQAGDHFAQVEQVVQQERDKAERLARELAEVSDALQSHVRALDDKAAQSKELFHLLKEEHAKTQDLARELATARDQLKSMAAASGDNARKCVSRRCSRARFRWTSSSFPCSLSS